MVEVVLQDGAFELSLPCPPCALPEFVAFVGTIIAGVKPTDAALCRPGICERQLATIAAHDLKCAAESRQMVECRHNLFVRASVAMRAADRFHLECERR